MTHHPQGPNLDIPFLISKFTNHLKFVVKDRLVPKATIPFQILLAVQKIKAYLEEPNQRRNNQGRDDKKILNKKNQRMWQPQSSQYNGSSKSSGWSRKSRFSSYRSCFNCGPQGHKKECPIHQQKSPLSYGGNTEGQSSLTHL